MFTKCLIMILFISSCSRIAQGKAINTTINAINSVSEISMLNANDISNLTSTTPPLPDNIIVEAINTTINVKNSTNEITTVTENDINNSTSTTIHSLIHNIIILSSQTIESLPQWAWIVLGITLGLMLCCLCCCPETLRGILCCPFRWALKIILFPVRCCLSCLGFKVVGPRAGSLAACFQSCCYGGHTPSGSCFSACQSFSMK